MSIVADIKAAGNTILTSMREPSDPDDDDLDRAELLFAATTTATKASGDNEDDRDEDDVVALAGLTTLTDSRGEHESDHDEDDPPVDASAGLVRGELRPLLYRFAEHGPTDTLSVEYDDAMQVSVLQSGHSVSSRLMRRDSQN
jgi:hypothetical protein